MFVRYFWGAEAKKTYLGGSCSSGSRGWVSTKWRWRHSDSLPRCRWNVRRTRLSTVGDHRTFPVAAARTWNSLPQHVTSAPLCLFCKVASRLSFSGFPSHDLYSNFCSACAVTTVVIFGQHLNRSFLFVLLTYFFTRTVFWPAENWNDSS